jgi:hypothetical protein
MKEAIPGISANFASLARRFYFLNFKTLTAIQHKFLGRIIISPKSFEQSVV